MKFNRGKNGYSIITYHVSCMSEKVGKGSSDDELIYGLRKAVETSWHTLKKQCAEDVIERTHCILSDTADSYIVKFLGEEYTLKPQERAIMINGEKPFYDLFKIGIILHYMVHAKDKPIANKLISFRELWGGNEYYPAFTNRVLTPLTEYFCDKPKLLMEAGFALGGVKVDKGEYGISIPILPRVPITVLLWTGDDEVEASGNLLFDGSANEYMETEGLVWLSIAAVAELKAKASEKYA